MFKRIGTKSYNTKTATYVGTLASNKPKNDSSYFEKHLYKKQTGEYFILGWSNAGGPFAKAVSSDNHTTEPGETIKPITATEASKLKANKNFYKSDKFSHDLFTLF